MGAQVPNLGSPSFPGSCRAPADAEGACAVTVAQAQEGRSAAMLRRYLTVLGAANKRLYQFRLQTADKTYEKAAVRPTDAGSVLLQLPGPLHAAQIVMKSRLGEVTPLLRGATGQPPGHRAVLPLQGGGRMRRWRKASGAARTFGSERGSCAICCW